MSWIHKEVELNPTKEQLMSEERLHCTKDNPMPKGAKGRWDHDNVVEVGEQRDGYPGGDLQDFKCLSCGHVWEQELAQ